MMFFSIFIGTEAEVKEFADKVNHLHDDIKCTVEYTQDSVIVLDTTVFFHDNRLRTTLYTKPTDSHIAISTSSRATASTIRVRKNYFLWKDFIQNALMLHFHPLKRGYPKDICDEAIFKVSRMTQQEALKKKEDKGNTENESQKRSSSPPTIPPTPISKPS